MSFEVGRLSTEPCHQVLEGGWCSPELLLQQHTDYQVATGNKEQLLVEGGKLWIPYLISIFTEFHRSLPESKLAKIYYHALYLKFW